MPNPYVPPPRKVGPNRYEADALYDALRSRESVDVVGTELNPNGEGVLPFPKDMDKIYLGTKTAPPTGVATNLHYQKPPIIDPRIKPVWDEIIAEHPYAGRNVRMAVVEPAEKMGAASADFSLFGDLRMRADRITKSNLLHELAHAAQSGQFFNLGAEQAHYYAGEDDPTDYSYEYPGRRGERVAREVARAGLDKATRER